MKLENRFQIGSSWIQGRILQWVNLRSEEGERTLLMFAFYTTTSIGLLWLEYSAIALFLKNYGAEGLPIIYITSAVIGSGLGLLYSWLSRILPLRSLLVAVAFLMALPLFLLRFGLDAKTLSGIIPLATVFILRLWMDAIDVLNDLNTSISANQLFNIREIKRTFPLISSGILVADVLSGFSLPLLLSLIKLSDIIFLAGVMMLLGSGILYILCQRYQQAFPDSPVMAIEELQPEYSSRRIRGPLQRYVIPLFTFFILSQILFLLIEFAYLGQLDQNLDAAAIANFLGVFAGIIGIFELITQWFISSRAVERLGVFVAAMLLPGALAILAIITLTGAVNFFWGLVALKFIDELFRYTLLASIGPVLFQPIPESFRNSLQAVVRGIAQTLSTGATGLGILAIIAAISWAFPKQNLFNFQTYVFISLIIILAFVWLAVAWLLRSSYVSLLVQSAQSSRLGFSDVDLRAFKRAVVEVLEQPGNTEADKRSCIQLLSQIDPPNVGEVLSPLLPVLSPALQRQSLEAMLEHPNPTHLSSVQALIEQKLAPEVLAVALRYVWLTEAEPDINILKPYLQERVDPIVRSTAAALILRLGNPTEKAEATNTLRRMLTSLKERERVMGTRALGEAAYLQALRLYIPNLLQDDSLRVRCALLEVIASTRLEEYYPSLLRGLQYKSTRATARSALVRLEDEAIPMLVNLAEDHHTAEAVQLQALMALGEIGTPEALNCLVEELMISWGTTRRNILRILLKMPNEAGIEGTLDRFGRSGIEMLIEQELLFLGQIYAAVVDLSVGAGYLPQIALQSLVNHRQLTPSLASVAAKGQLTPLDLLLRSLGDLQSDVVERCFLLMKFLYPLSAIQAAAFNLESDSRSNIALALEILDNTLDLARKRVLLGVLDRRSPAEKLQSLSEMVPYQPMNPSDRLRRLLELRHFLSDWPLACCFHLARQAKWSLTPEQTLVCLRHPTGFVREAVLAYLKVASPRTLYEMLPALKNDPDRLVAEQVQQIMAEL